MEELRFVEENGVSLVEADPENAFIVSVDDSRRIVESCYYYRADAVLLYPKNLPESFFDLSSGQAGEILQKLRNYRIRLALVCPDVSSVRFSSRFGEMMAEEQKGRDFALFPSRTEALEWLRSNQE